MIRIEPQIVEICQNILPLFKGQGGQLMAEIQLFENGHILVPRLRVTDAYRLDLMDDRIDFADGTHRRHHRHSLILFFLNMKIDHEICGEQALATGASTTAARIQYRLIAEAAAHHPVDDLF